MNKVGLHWHGGIHTAIHIEKRATPKGCRADPGLVETVQALASIKDAEIARILNMKQLQTPRGLRWTQDRVRNFRTQHHILYQPVGDGDNFLTCQQTARILGVSRHGVEALLRIGVLHNEQTIDFAPWRIPRTEVESERVREVVKVMKANRTLPKNFTLGGCPSDQQELFSMIPRVQG